MVKNNSLAAPVRGRQRSVRGRNARHGRSVITCDDARCRSVNAKIAAAQRKMTLKMILAIRQIP